MNKWLTSTVDTYINNFGHATTPIIYEVGSRDGNDGAELADRIYSGSDVVRDTQLILFECNPLQQGQIEARYPEATLIREAISDKKGKASFIQLFGDKNIVGSSSLDLNRAELPWGKKNSVIEVQTRRLDSVIKELKHEDTDIDIMKIDIEGYTWEALQGLGKYLRNVRVFHLETEIADIARNKNNLEIFEFMEGKGYRCTALENEWGHTIQDQVWVRI